MKFIKEKTEEKEEKKRYTKKETSFVYNYKKRKK
jgi:hypothetical protein